MEVILLAGDRFGRRTGRSYVLFRWLHCAWIHLILLILLFTIPLSSFCEGDGENPIAKAEQQIEDREKNEAMKTLADALRENKDSLDAVEEQMRKIREIQKEFNEKYEELMKVLYEEKDVVKALQIIEELLALDPNPNKSTLEAITRARRGALMVANQNRFNRIMDEALALLKRGEYYRAAQTYLPGFDLYRDEFDDAGYGQIVELSVDSAVKRVFAAVERLAGQKASHEADRAAFTGTIKAEQLNELPGRLSSFYASVDVLEELRNDLAEAASALTRHSQLIKEGRSDKSEDYFLFYAQRVLKGRRDLEEREGIINSLALLLESEFADREDLLTSEGQTRLDEGKRRYNQEAYTRTEALMTEARSYFQALMELTYRRDAGEKLSPQYTGNTSAGIILTPELLDFVWFQERFRETLAYEAIVGQSSGITDLDAFLEAPGLSAREGLRKAIEDAEGVFDALVVEWTDYTDLLKAEHAESAEAAKSMVAVTLGAAHSYLASYQRVLGLVIFRVVNRLDNESDKLLNGEVIRVTRTTDAGAQIEEDRVVKYPDERLANLRELKNDLIGLDGDLDGITASWHQGEQTALRSPEISLVLDSAQIMIGQEQELLRRIEDLISDANQEIILAQRYAREGRERYSAAQGGFNRNKFEDARIDIRSATEALDRSLGYREDPEIRKLRDVVFPAFLTRINQAENTFVVAEVRRLIDQAIGDYREGDFGEAENLLVRAQNRWHDTNASDNEEVLDWLTLVRRAMNLTRGWEIVVTDPLYAEITQLLKFATEDYNNGVRLFEDDKEVEARKAFDSAVQTLATIRIPFPLLKVANTLQLKISRILEPDEFRTLFGKTKASARQKLLSAGRAGRPELLETYNQLKEYEQVEPNDRDLAGLIIEFEYALDLKIRPPSQAEIAQSRQTYQTGKSIYDKRQRDLYDRAVELLNEAIKLWPDNKAAVLLKDRILIATGGARQDIISSDDSKKLENAEKLFSERNYAESYRIVQVLLQSSKNQNYPRLLDLEAKLKRRLGIQ